MIKSQLQNLYQDTVFLYKPPADAVLDAGDLVTIKKTPGNTTPVPRPSSFGDVIHMDCFWPGYFYWYILYGLLFTACFSRMTYIYPLQNLMSDIHQQTIGFSPKRLISVFNTKLIAVVRRGDI